MTKEIRMTNAKSEPKTFDIRDSSFSRHSSFVIRHFPAVLLMTMLAPAADASAASTDADAKRIVEVRKILQQVPLIDGHNDLPWQFRKRGNDLSTIDLSRDNRALKPPVVTDIPRLRAGGVGGQFWSVYVPAIPGGSTAVQAVLEQIDVV